MRVEAILVDTALADSDLVERALAEPALVDVDLVYTALVDTALVDTADALFEPRLEVKAADAALNFAGSTDGMEVSGGLNPGLLGTAGTTPNCLLVDV